MRTVFRVLAYLIAAEVVVQAAAIAWAVFGESAFIEGGGVVDKALVESGSTSVFDGAAGYAVHGMNGTVIVPILGLLILVAGFFAKVDRGAMWGAITFGFVALQIVLGIFGHVVPFVGLLHGINAILLFCAALYTARLASVRAPLTTGTAAVS
jgi:hypothetical protein